MNHLPEVRAAIVKACPDIERHHDINGVFHDERDIRLADVLRAVGKHEGNPLTQTGIQVFSDGSFNWQTKPMNIGWNLADDNLDHATPECVEFLYSILCKPV